MSNSNKTALVAGATGVVGQSILQHLSDLEDWEVIAISRRHPDIVGDYQHIEIDLLDKDDCRDKLGNLHSVSHIFYAAYVERANLHEMIEPNFRMLANLGEEFLNGWTTQPDEPIRKLIEGAFVQAGLKVTPIAFRGCTNANISAGALGIQSLIYGPGNLDLAHKPNEHVEITDLLISAGVYIKLAIK